MKVVHVKGLAYLAEVLKMTFCNRSITQIVLCCFFVASWTSVVLCQSESRYGIVIMGWQEPPGDDVSFSLELHNPGTSQVTVIAKTAEDRIVFQTDLAAGDGEKQVIDDVRNHMMNASEIAPKGIVVTATDEIILQGFQKRGNVEEGFLGIPFDKLGSSYYVSTFCPYGGHCQFAVMAFADDTSVSIALPPEVHSLRYCFGTTMYNERANEPITLNAFEVVQLESPFDLSGTLITSNKVVSVFAGARDLKDDVDGDGRYYIIEQLFPMELWGSKFLVPATTEDGIGDVVQIVTGSESTRVDIQGSGVYLIEQAGVVLQRRLEGKEYLQFESDKPIQAVHITGMPYANIETASTVSMYEVQATNHFGNKFSVRCPATQRAVLVFWNEDDTVDIGSETGEQVTTTRDGMVIKLINATSQTYTLSHSSVALGGTLFCDRSSMPLGLALNAINNPSSGTSPSPCSPTIMTLGDGIDNDCDGLIDEDSCSSLDIKKEIEVAAASSFTEVNFTGRDFFSFNLQSCDMTVMVLKDSTESQTAIIVTVTSSDITMTTCINEVCHNTVSEIWTTPGSDLCIDETFWYGRRGNDVEIWLAPGYGDDTITVKTTVPNLNFDRASFTTVMGTANIVLNIPEDGSKDCKWRLTDIHGQEDMIGRKFEVHYPPETIEGVNLFAGLEAGEVQIYDSSPASANQIYKEINITDKTNFYSNSVNFLDRHSRLKANTDVSLSVIAGDTTRGFTGYVVHPTDVLSTSYMAITYQTSQSTSHCTVSTLDRVTNVKITPMEGTTLSLNGSSTLETDLQVYSSVEITATSSDITGTLINTDNPVAVFCGNDNPSSGIKVFNQMIPFAYWGKEYIVPGITQAIPGLTTKKIRIVAAYDDTLVTVVTQPDVKSYVIIEDAGKYTDELINDVSDIVTITATNTIAVGLVLSDSSSTKGTFTILPATKQYVSNNLLIPNLDVNTFPPGLTSTIVSVNTEGAPQTFNTPPNNEVKWEDTTAFGLTILHNSDRWFALITNMGFDSSQEASDVCSVGKGTVLDGIDNDCDGLIDEEICYTGYGKFRNDHDLDGAVAEDCGCELPDDELVPPVPVCSQELAECVTFCECPCEWFKYENLTKEEKDEIVSEGAAAISQNLTVDTKATAAAEAKKVSAEDSRTSAVGMGYLGIAMLSLVFGGLILLDAQAIVVDAQRLAHNVRDLFGA